MADIQVIGDLEHDPDGNVRHLAEHDISPEEFEEVLEDHHQAATTSRSTGEVRRGRNMGVKRISRRAERSPEQLARVRAVRERFERERPTLEELVASGDYNEPILQGAYLELRQLMRALRAERERQGLSLTDVADGCGIDKAALSRLESGQHINPTLTTLWRYALTLSKEITFAVRDAPPVRQVRAQPAQRRRTSVTSR